MNARHAPVYLLVLTLCGGCMRNSSGLLQETQRARQRAERAYEKHDVAAADLAAARAEETLGELKRRGNAAPDLLSAAGTAALSARNFAQLAHEEQQVREILASFKISAYQKVRGMLCNYGLAAPAFAAEQLGRVGTNSASAEQALAGLAWRLAQWAGPGSNSTNGTQDWMRVAADLRSWSNHPPAVVGMFLALTFTVSGWTDFGLSEIESVDPARLTSTNTKSLYHLERCALLAFHGWDRSAARELERAIQLSPAGWHGIGTTQALAVFHLWLAEHALGRDQHEQANAELAQAAKVWPESPLAAFVRSEQLARNGDWKPAADLLEAQANATKNSWLVRRLGQRAAELREKKGDCPPVFAQPSFLFEVLAYGLSESAENTAGQKLQGFLADAKMLGLRLVDKLPRIGEKTERGTP